MTQSQSVCLPGSEPGFFDMALQLLHQAISPPCPWPQRHQKVSQQFDDIRMKTALEGKYAITILILTIR